MRPYPVEVRRLHLERVSKEINVQRRMTALSIVLVFLCCASSPATLVLSENFTYSDGPISTVSGGSWTIHSGTDSGATALNVTSGQAIINQGDTHAGGADANRLLSTTFDPATDNTSKLYASFTVNFSALPVTGDSDGSYFAHLKSSAANEFYARIGANTNGAAANMFRLAVANESWNVANTVEFPLDLSLNTTYTVVARLDLATDQTTLWVNPVTEASTSVTATDAISYAVGTINAYALRQGTSGTGAPGILAVDSLLVGTAFADVVSAVPEPSAVLFGTLVCGVIGLGVGGRRLKAKLFARDSSNS
jgi:hypothetical protein